ncbi:hypothetical protein [Paenarthrobacter sp. C1]|uniref:hypothetical protein n=1 Tax=Paenarthrobacter sp. C1 TaxID=3400220 RepID=UPI003BF4E28B
MTLLSEQTTALAGLEGTVTQTTYALPGDRRCDVVRVHVPAAAQGRTVTATSSYKLQAKYVTATKNELVYRGGGENINIPVAKTPATIGGRTELAGEAVVASHIYDVTQTGTDFDTSEPYTSTALGVKWSLTITMAETSSTHYVAVPKKTVKAAAAARDLAITDRRRRDRQAREEDRQADPPRRHRPRQGQEGEEGSQSPLRAEDARGEEERRPDDRRRSGHLREGRSAHRRRDPVPGAAGQATGQGRHPDPRPAGHPTPDPTPDPTVDPTPDPGTDPSDPPVDSVE